MYTSEVQLLFMCLHPCMWTSTPACMRRCTHTHAHARVHARVHTHTHTCTRAHTHTQASKHKHERTTHTIHALQASDIRWASRWDTYLLMIDDQIHWFSIINSVMIVLFLTGMVAMIIVRTLHRDITKYNQLESGEDAQEETGWKLVGAAAGAGSW